MPDCRLSVVVRPVVGCFVPSEIGEGDGFGEMVFDLAECPFGQEFGGGGFVGDEDSGVALQYELKVFVVIFPDGEPVVELVVDAFHHDVFEELEVHDHTFPAVACFSDNRAFNGGYNHSTMAVQLVAE